MLGDLTVMLHSIKWTIANATPEPVMRSKDPRADWSRGKSDA